VFRLVFASLITFGLLTGMVAGVIRAAMVSSGDVNLGLAINLTIAINLAIWLISPRLSDVTLRWFNKLIFLDDADPASGWAHSGAARRLAAGTGGGGPRRARDASPPLPIGTPKDATVMALMSDPSASPIKARAPGAAPVLANPVMPSRHRRHGSSLIGWPLIE
jgi:hypothetical protein